jgi:chemotaxis protein CheX
MKNTHIDLFVKSAIAVFSKMLSWSLTQKEALVWSDAHPAHDITGTVELSGGGAGTVVLSFERDVALAAAETLLADRPDDVNEDVLDAVGEITSMIAGSAKSALQQYSIDISLPKVIVGKQHEIQFPSQATPICIPLESEAGEMSLVVGFAEQKATQPAAV